MSKYYDDYKKYKTNIVYSIIIQYDLIVSYYLNWFINDSVQ